MIKSILFASCALFLCAEACAAEWQKQETNAIHAEAIMTEDSSFGIACNVGEPDLYIYWDTGTVIHEQQSWVVLEVTPPHGREQKVAAMAVASSTGIFTLFFEERIVNMIGDEGNYKFAANFGETRIMQTFYADYPARLDDLKNRCINS